MKRFLLSIGMCIAFFGISFGQSTILLEDFEDAIVYYSTSITEFTDSGQDYFKRTDGSDITGESFSSINGDFYFGAQDIDGDGATLPVTLTIDNIDITGYSSLILRVYLAEDATGASEHWDAGDYVRITGDIDEGSTQNLIWVENPGGSNAAPKIDSDFDGTGDGAEITDTFTQYSVSISGTGSSLDIAIEFDLNDGNTDIAIDNIEILGTKTLPNKIISGDAGWRLLSLPKTGGYVEDVADDTPVQGIVDGADPSADANFYIYDNSGTWEKPTNDGASWGDGLGFALYFYNNTTNNSTALPLTLDVSGSEPSSQVDVTLNAAASGYTLVGNPFASNYNTNSMTATSSNISNTIAFWNDGTNSYSTQDRTANSGYIISPWQGFWVQTISAASTTLSFPTSGKTTSSVTGTFFSKSVNNRGDISFTLTSETTYDEAIRLAFRENATFGFDADDFGKLPPLSSPYAIMAFESNDMLKSVESLPWNLEEEVNLSLKPQFVGVDGEFTFTWNGLETIPADWEIVLHDYEMEVSLDMREVSEYVFVDESDTQAKVNPLSLLIDHTSISLKSKTEENRFGITISPASVNNELDKSPLTFTLDQNYPNPFNPSTTISYTIQEAGAVNISVYNLMGQKVATLVDETKSAGQHNVRWNAANVSSGMYYYRLEANGQAITRKMTLIK